MNEIVCSTVYGKVCLPDNSMNDPVIFSICNTGVFEPYIIECIRPFVKPGSIVIDAGASYGQMSLAFSQMVGDEGEVHSFEVSEYIIQYLKNTLSINNTKNIFLHNIALWHTSNQTLKMLKPTPFGWWYSGLGVAINEETDYRMKICKTYDVLTTTLDDINFSKPISAIKIDVQGSDYAVLKGAKNTILKHKPLILFEYESFYDDKFQISFKDYLDFLNDINYEIRVDIINNNHDFACLPKQ